MASIEVIYNKMNPTSESLTDINFLIRDTHNQYKSTDLSGPVSPSIFVLERRDNLETLPGVIHCW